MALNRHSLQTGDIFEKFPSTEIVLGRGADRFLVCSCPLSPALQIFSRPAISLGKV